MSIRIETEKKYFCANNEELLAKIKALNFKLISYANEIDEYFTDINSEYIKNRTCLRIRKTDENLEITFKGKSKDSSNTFSKLESNFNINSNNYENFVNLFSNIGYYSYTIVDKTRYTYQILEDNYSYSIMVDNIEGLGGFVEFELLDNSNTNNNEDDLKNRLNKFISNFDDLNLEEAKLPYRDFVSVKMYNDYLPKNKVKGIHLNLDTFLKSYEKDFYNFYKSIMNKTSLKLQEFRENICEKNLTPEINKKIDNYFDNLRIKDSNLMLLLELLKQIKKLKLDIILSTNCNNEFTKRFLLRDEKQLIDDIIYLNNNKSIYKELEKHCLDLKEYFNISKLNLKETNSILLVIINNFGITK